MPSFGCVQFPSQYCWFLVYHCLTHICGIVPADNVPRATAFILVSVLLMRVPAVIGVDRGSNMVFASNALSHGRFIAAFHEMCSYVMLHYKSALMKGMPLISKELMQTMHNNITK